MSLWRVSHMTLPKLRRDIQRQTCTSSVSLSIKLRFFTAKLAALLRTYYFFTLNVSKWVFFPNLPNWKLAHQLTVNLSNSLLICICPIIIKICSLFTWLHDEDLDDFHLLFFPLICTKILHSSRVNTTENVYEQTKFWFTCYHWFFFLSTTHSCFWKSK